MSSYKELIQQREALELQIAQVRAQEISQAITQVRSLIADFGLTQDEIFPSGKTTRVAKNPSGKVAPKYLDPVSGSTWTGRGKPPTWIRDEANRDAFLIA
jgi:DNA-binding protein H-NS